MSEAFRNAFETAHPELARRLNFNVPAADVGLYNFSHCKMGDEGMRYVHGIVEHPERIENLLFARNELTDDSAPLLADIIKRAPNLFDVDISHNAFTEKGLAVLAEAMGDHPDLEIFRSTKNAIQGKGEAIVPLFCERLADEARQGKISKGSAFLLSALDELPPAELVELFHGQGVTFGAKELLEADDKPSPLLRRFTYKPGGLEALFTVENWQGNKGEMNRVYNALPDDKKPVNYHTLLQQMRARQNVGIGR